jgi:hypothetical protein
VASFAALKDQHTGTALAQFKRCKDAGKAGTGNDHIPGTHASILALCI